MFLFVCMGVSVVYVNLYFVCFVVCLGVLCGYISGLCDGYVQVNIVMLCDMWVNEFLCFCQFNLKLCLLLDVIELGVFVFWYLGQDVDVCCDVLCYCVYCNGELVEELVDVEVLWIDDMVVFVIGCFFLFEYVLMEVGVLLCYIVMLCNVVMYCMLVDMIGMFCLVGKFVVLMWLMLVFNVICVIEIILCMLCVYGVLVYFGDFVVIGIVDLVQFDWGDVVFVQFGEVVVFWVCGVIFQVVVQ